MSTKVYYNDNDQKCCAWLSSLMDAGLIRPGRICNKSISDLDPESLKQYELAHFFAGIGGWDYAIKLAAYEPRGRVTWTGSCPCQPFSCAGKGLAEKDARHLWPVFRELIRQCRPATIFGEQVASAAGRLWYAGVRADLETMGYRVGAADLCAASAGEEGEGRIVRGDSQTWEQLLIGAPHIRQRLYWVGHATSDNKQRHPVPGENRKRIPPGGSSGIIGLEHPNSQGRLAGQHGAKAARHGDSADTNGSPGWMGDTTGERRERPQPKLLQPEQTERRLLAGPGSTSRVEHAALSEEERLTALSQHLPEQTNFWSDFQIVPCGDNKARRIESGTQPLAHGVPGRVAQLRGLGNAIVPEIAAEFIKAYLETL